MFKKKKISYTHFVYTIYDTIGKKFHGTFYHTTDEDMIRISLPTVLMDFALRDIEVLRIGTFNDDTGELNGTHPVHIPTDCYLFPHSRLSSVGDDLPIEEVDSKMKEYKAEQVSKLSEMKNQKKEVVNE